LDARPLLLAAALAGFDALTLQRAAAEQLDVAPVPEPETWAFLAGGLVLVAHRRKAARRRR
jgi:hypothetical protein